MAEKYCKLIMVAVGAGSAAQSNKYYEMLHDGKSSTFTVKYGRVEATETVISKPIHEWDSIYRSKVKKGYKDVTAFVSVTVTDNVTTPSNPLQKTKDQKVNEFLDLMQKYTNNLVATTYSVKATNVTQAQIDTAQKHIDDLVKVSKAAKLDETKANRLLLELYTTIPRQMRDVRDNLIPSIKLDKILQQEQDNLDAMASQVAALQPTKVDKKADKKTRTLLDTLGISKMIEVKRNDAQVDKDLGYLLRQQFGKRVEAIFEINKPSEDKNIEEWMATKSNKTTKLLIHGTRCTSVIPIMEQGLKIRPAGNFQFSGKAYGDGNYFSEVMQKSLNYVGHDNDIVMFVYEVHTGNPFVYNGWYRGNSFPLTLKELSSRGYDSTYVSAGNGLLNSEIIAYSEKQNHLKYILWLKR